MKNYLIPLALIAAMVGVGAYSTWNLFANAKNPDPNHTHADFAIWINGEQLDFSDPKYMSGSSDPTDPHHTDHDPYLHLHDGNGHVVHRHKPGLGFGDFLRTLGFVMEGTCLVNDAGLAFCDDETHNWRLFVNGAEVPFQSNYIFDDGDHLLFTYGSDDAAIQDQLRRLTDDACLYSKTCPWRGSPPAENCIADPSVPCVVQ